MTKKMICAILIVAAFAVFSSAIADAKMIVKYGHVGPPIHPQHQGALAFAKYVAEKTKGEIEVQVFPLGQLGGERSMTEQVQGGTLQMTAVTAGVLANFVPQIGIIELPFIYPNREVAYKVLDDKEVKERFTRYCDAKGFVFIGYTENEFRDLTNSKRPVRKPTDMKGLKIRVLESPMMIDTFRALGANPTPLPFPEIYNALQQKVIDGQDNPIYTSILMKFTEVNKFATITNHILTECPTVVNKAFWNSLTPEQQKIFREAAEVQIKVNREGNAKNRVDALAKAKAQKVDVTILTNKERDAFKKAVQPVLDKYRTQLGTEWFDFFLKKINFYAKKK
ncbi:DctP family TRAP transporter solute-binding subunit [Syntrophorhabdus aromaticivorans]|uniref:DctP family TRAP transporter solute-binding subunit n=1 Tax=Syntrophorhabdus aromaticivorans TaxID=328301 RepID=UPI000404E4DD|nr:DctP family TRAP transporter solute-binding subunit [Syntrophorhabdus aromaticivorans]